MDNVDIYRIKMHLENKTINQISSERCIPVFTEDDEARLFLECIFNYFNKINDSFSKIRQLFFLVDANISSEALYNIFSSGLIVTSAIRSICVLDGDQYNRADYTKYTIVLPGEKAPEQLVFEYVEKIYKDNNEFWNSQFLLDNGYTKVYCRDNILKDIKNIDKNIQEIKNKGGSVKGIRREENKKVFREYEKFFKFVIEYWISDSNNKQQIDKFYEDLRIMFKKVSDFHDISSKEWE